MKRFFICAAAAIVALAACSKTEVINNSVPQEIGFKAINMPMTKAAYDQNLGVSAYMIDGGAAYFEKTLFELNTGQWKGGQYWPLEGALGFVAYGPGTDCATTVTTSPTGISAEGVKSDVDFVYSKAYANNGGTGYTKVNAPASGVPVELAHSKAKITVNVTDNSENEAVTKVEIKGANSTGNFSYEFSGAPSWTGEATADFDFTSDKTHYVIPGTPTTLRITYDRTAPAATGLTYDIDLDTVKKTGEETLIDAWTAGFSYTYNVTITGAEIIINATVDEWTEVEGSTEM